MLTSTTEALSAGVKESEFLPLLEYQMRSIDFISKLQDRTLLSELQILLDQLSGSGSPTNPILGAYAAWLADRPDDAAEIIETALALCPPVATPSDPELCNLLRDFKVAIGESESGDTDD
jgi:hypothetical protein